MLVAKLTSAMVAVPPPVRTKVAVETTVLPLLCAPDACTLRLIDATPAVASEMTSPESAAPSPSASCHTFSSAKSVSLESILPS